MRKKENNIILLFSSCIIISMKMFEDRGMFNFKIKDIKNKYYYDKMKINSFELKDLNNIEVEILKENNYNMLISLNDFNKFIDFYSENLSLEIKKESDINFEKIFKFFNDN
jgi:hypothetical protein